MSEKMPKTETIYKTIMERLITEMKDDMMSEGCGEEIIKQLKTVSLNNFNYLILIQIWENKMIEAGIFNPNKVNKFIHYFIIIFFLFFIYRNINIVKH